ncbi:MAG TPA: benzoate-CoA ligase family protein [Vicinamibacterales bacterium]|nr:benzoate-CoA ligase family protein [Vicinamibacterales bacterium]
MIRAADLGVPESFNAATHFVDRHAAEGRGATVAIECGDERVTHADLAERVNRCGSALRDRLGVRPEERVILLLLDTPAFAAAFFGAIKIGAVPIPLNTLWKTADYRYVLNDSGARVAIVHADLLPRIAAIPRGDVPALEHIVVVGDGSAAGYRSFDDLLDEGAPELVPHETRCDSPAFWLYSSGSTGAPKGCVHLHHDMVVCAELFGKGVLGIGPADRCFSVAKLFFAYGLGNALYFPLAVGATSILMPGPPLPANVYATIERHRPTLFSSVPTGYGMLLSHPGSFDLSSIRLAVSAGESLPASLYERFKRRFDVDILDGIGSTEVLHMFISNRPDAIRPGSSGLIVPGYDGAIRDEHGEPVSGGGLGDLWIRGDSTCAGYWNQEEKTRATIQGEWIRTGDRYTQDADGFYWYAGRSDDMLKVGGQWVSPIEVENALVAHDAVQECGVAGREDADTLIKPVAFVVLRPGIEGSPALAAELQQFVRARLADYKRPRRVEFVTELPRTATGKLQRFKLRGDASGLSGPIADR